MRMCDRRAEPMVRISARIWLDATLRAVVCPNGEIGRVIGHKCPNIALIVWRNNTWSVSHSYTSHEAGDVSERPRWGGGHRGQIRGGTF